MSRLISDEDVKKLLTDRYEGYEYIMADVDAIPTAFDKEKVLEQLKEEYAKEMIFGFNNINDPLAKVCSDNKAFAYTKAIEVVKGGGLDG